MNQGNRYCFRQHSTPQTVFHEPGRVFPDLRQELAVRERTTTDRMSAPSSPTLDIDKMDSAVQASLSLPATPVGKSMEHPFNTPKGQAQQLASY